MKTREFLHDVMSLACQLVKHNGYTMSEALKCAWANMKLRTQMQSRVVKFYFQKVDGSVREAWGTLSEKIVPATGEDNRKKNDTVQTYFDTDRRAWRACKKANLIRIA